MQCLLPEFFQRVFFCLDVRWGAHVGYCTWFSKGPVQNLSRGRDPCVLTVAVLSNAGQGLKCHL